MISVIVPVYNVEKYVVRCLQSIQNQTYPDYEVLIIDDGSTDSSGDLCEDFAVGDKRFRVIHQKNGGLSAARNTGLDNATGEYVIFIDSDDYIHPQMLEILYECCEKTEADISICRFRRIEDGEEVGFEPISDDEYDISVLAGEESCYKIYVENSVETVVSTNKLYRREIWEKMRFPMGKIHEDEFVTYKLLYDAKKVAYTDAKLYFYVQRSDSIMLNKNYGSNHMVILEMAEESIVFYMEKKNNVLVKLAVERAVELSKILYQKYGCAERKDLQKVVLSSYRSMFKKYHKFMNIDISSKIIMTLYGYSPELSQILGQFKHKLWLLKHRK